MILCKDGTGNQSQEKKVTTHHILLSFYSLLIPTTKGHFPPKNKTHAGLTMVEQLPIYIQQRHNIILNCKTFFSLRKKVKNVIYAVLALTCSLFDHTNTLKPKNTTSILKNSQKA